VPQSAKADDPVASTFTNQVAAAFTGCLLMITRPNVLTIPASLPFLPTLVRALLDGWVVPDFPGTRDPLALARATIYLPTRRACRLARDVFLDMIGEPPAHRCDRRYRRG
jgi:hypothetical protein